MAKCVGKVCCRSQAQQPGSAKPAFWSVDAEASLHRQADCVVGDSWSAWPGPFSLPLLNPPVA